MSDQPIENAAEEADAAEGEEVGAAGAPVTPVDLAPPTPPAPPAVAAEARTVEDWARDEGMLPEVFDGGAMQVNAHPHALLARISLRRSSEVARRHNSKYRFFAAAKAMFRWPEGLKLTKANFDKAIEAADTGVKIR